MEKIKRQNNILDIIRKLDITPTMYKNAVEKYNQLAKYLTEHGIRAEIYAQGSFALGTVVRPVFKGDDAAYDLDFICQVYDDKNSLTAAELRKKVQSILESSNLYSNNLLICDECFTIVFADVDGIGFSVDIVPAVAESPDKILKLYKASKNSDLIDSAIAIPKKESTNYSWLTNNPKGYKKWFDEINLRFNEVSKFEFRQRLLENNKHIFNSIQEIPEGLDRSALQRVIQLLKYHRDIYYKRIKDGDKLKPISAIIGTIVAKIAATANDSLNVFELLEFVLDEFDIYSKQMTLNETLFASRYQFKNIILKKGSTWVIENPANPEDNLADQWDDETANKFFLWTKAVRKDLLDALELIEENEFRVIMENAFEKNIVDKAFPNQKQVNISPKPIYDTGASKPWNLLS